MLLSVSWVEHEYRMGTWPGGKGRGERFGGHGGGGGRAGWVMSRVGNDRGELDRGEKVRWESAGGDRLDPSRDITRHHVVKNTSLYVY